MSRPWPFTAFLILVVSSRALAQHPAGAPTATRQGADAAGFDFLLGKWEVTATPTVSSLVARLHGVPKLKGSWMAQRSTDGTQISDELRIVDESGNAQSITHATRRYDATTKRWQITVRDDLRPHETQSTAQMVGGDMAVTNHAVAGDAYIGRSRFTEIGPDRFRCLQDRSYDGGKTWEDPRLIIEARRIGPKAAR